jgi:hypothetical protein
LPLKSAFSEACRSKNRLLLGIDAISSSPCPTGEQITNGGFETGDFTGWTVVDAPYSPYPPRTAEVFDSSSGITPYSGTYYAYFLHSYGNPPTSISQDLVTACPVSCFGASSVFELYVMGNYSVCGGGNVVNIIITYTDDSTTQVDYAVTSDVNWEHVDLKPYLEVGKTVKSIKIAFNQDFGFCGVDAVRCIPSP